MGKLKIGFRITCSMVITALLTATLSLILFSALSKGAFTDYVKENRIQEGMQISDILGEAYSNNGWNGIIGIVESSFCNGMRHQKSCPGPIGHGMGQRYKIREGHGFSPRKIIVTDTRDNIMASSEDMDYIPEYLNDMKVPVYSNGEKIGYVIIWTPMSPDVENLESIFGHNISRYSRWAFIFGLGIALLIGYLVSRRLLMPIKDLSIAVRAFSKGKRNIKIPVTTKDELGSLATDFNNMAQKIKIAEEQRRNLTADVAHELRTPLSILSGILESIQEGVLEPTPDIILSMQDEIFRMSRLAKDLSDISKAEAGNLELSKKTIHPTDFEDKLSYFKTQANLKNIDFILDIPDNLPKISVDVVRIMQVISNLLNNALRHTSAGFIKLWARKNENNVLFCIEDTGTGIKESELPHVFERFYREDKSRSRKTGGMGLGLAITKSIVKAHGGDIWVESQLGKGSKFFFSLPTNGN